MDLQTLDDLRCQLFEKSVIKSKFNLARLPPTQDAARYHAFRTYHQVQTWMGREKNPLDWGWTTGRQGLTPIKTTINAAPDSLLQTISCQCKKGCTKACSCRKAGLHCSIICKNCSGQSCENVPEIITHDDDIQEEAVSIIDQMITQENEDIEHFIFVIEEDESDITCKTKRSKV